jgi:hypothetical protein
MEHAAAGVLITPKNFLIIAPLVVAAFLTSATFGFAQAVAQVTTVPTGDQSPFHLVVTSNLVVVRVVVRDAQNKPVENLKQEDFKLFDRGKQQSITQFAVETTAAEIQAPTRT